MRLLHLEQVGGVSGDMLLGALIGLGLEPREMEAAIRSLGLPELELAVSRVERNGAPATRVEVLVNGRPAEDHSHAHPHDHPHEQGHAHPHDHGQPHHHGHDHHHDHEHTHGGHRRLADIERLLAGSALSPEVQARALAVFGRLAAAEAEVHGVAISDVHFHEVGAWDSIADVVGAVWGLERLGIDRFTCGPFVLGRGEVAMAHGRWPVPAPATVRLLEGADIRFVDLTGETVTPTGAAVLVTLAEAARELPTMRLEQVAAGAGRREWPDRPNILRAFLGSTDAINDGGHGGFPDGGAVPEPVDGAALETVAVVSTQVDDMTPQAVADLASRLLEAGALDVMTVPVLMKKGRPGVEVVAVARPGDEGSMVHHVLQHSATLGVRLRREWRFVLPRRILEIDTPLGRARVKLTRRPGRDIEALPEFEDCQKISHRTGNSLQYVAEQVRHAAQEALQAGKITL